MLGGMLELVEERIYKGLCRDVKEAWTTTARRSSIWKRGEKQGSHKWCKELVFIVDADNHTISKDDPGAGEKLHKNSFVKAKKDFLTWKLLEKMSLSGMLTASSGK